ncbi:hypothetical protein OEZ86_012685 [Tetradesmus obliquus]|nr:hypothetical protein OEZ86_012685 [Tetradesmus obliquus]
MCLLELRHHKPSLQLFKQEPKHIFAAVAITVLNTRSQANSLAAGGISPTQSLITIKPSCASTSASCHVKSRRSSRDAGDTAGCCCLAAGLGHCLAEQYFQAACRSRR